MTKKRSRLRFGKRYAYSKKMCEICGKQRTSVATNMNRGLGQRCNECREGEG